MRLAESVREGASSLAEWEAEFALTMAHTSIRRQPQKREEIGMFVDYSLIQRRTARPRPALIIITCRFGREFHKRSEECRLMRHDGARMHAGCRGDRARHASG